MKLSQVSIAKYEPYSVPGHTALSFSEPAVRSKRFRSPFLPPRQRVEICRVAARTMTGTSSDMTSPSNVADHTAGVRPGAVDLGEQDGHT